jgi:antibiotic biosynthesis monooxygenase (ABM) superfamily enzyme
MSIHVAILRRVRPGRERDFEARLREFVSASIAVDGVRGVLNLAPADGGQEFGILRTFEGPDERDAFYQSPLFRQWQADIAHLVEGPAHMRALHGLEAWFRSDGHPQPPRWKMAALTLLGVYPLALALPAVLHSLNTALPGWARTLLVSVSMVSILTWLVMPRLVHLARPWLKNAKEST